MHHLEHLGLQCALLETSFLRVLVSVSAGPRISWFGRAGQPNLMAELPDWLIPTAHGNFHLRGGHRLWCAPEEPATTYLPDNSPLTLSEQSDRHVVVWQDVQSNGIQKGLSVRVLGENHLQITHHLTNHAPSTQTLAAWAITMLRPDGFAILPQTQDKADVHGLLPNRALNLWAYSNINSPQLQLGNAFHLLQTNFPSGEIFKLGWQNPLGWMAYHWQDTLFVKHAHWQKGADYCDLNSNAECFVRREFLELETLSPLTTLATGECLTHTEDWWLYDGVPCTPEADAVQTLLRQLALTGAFAGISH
jgi:hypothetical protein